VSSFLTAHQHILGYSVPYDGVITKSKENLISSSALWYFQSIVGEAEINGSGDVSSKFTWTRGYDGLHSACNSRYTNSM